MRQINRPPSSGSSSSDYGDDLDIFPLRAYELSDDFLLVRRPKFRQIRRRRWNKRSSDTKLRNQIKSDNESMSETRLRELTGKCSGNDKSTQVSSFEFSPAMSNNKKGRSSNRNVHITKPERAKVQLRAESSRIDDKRLAEAINNKLSLSDSRSPRTSRAFRTAQRQLTSHEPPVRRSHHATINRNRYQKNIEYENLEMYKRLQRIKPTDQIRRDAVWENAYGTPRYLGPNLSILLRRRRRELQWQ